MALISAPDAAILTALNLHRRSEEIGKPLSRVRVSERTLQLITGRRRLEGRFLEDYAAELLDLGWVIVRTHSAWGFQLASAVAGWPRVNASRIEEELERVAQGDLPTIVALARDEVGCGNGSRALGSERRASDGLMDEAAFEQG